MGIKTVKKRFEKISKEFDVTKARLDKAFKELDSIDFPDLQDEAIINRYSLNQLENIADHLESLVNAAKLISNEGREIKC